MKGVSKLEQELRVAADRATKLHESGRISKNSITEEIFYELSAYLQNCIRLAEKLEKFEIGREGNESD